MVSLLLALSKCVLIPQMRCTWHKHAFPPPLIPSVATNAARAAITSARCCLYHSFSSEPPLPLFTSSECPPSLLIPRATFYPPIPKPFHDDPNPPSPPHIPLLGTCVPPGQQASSHNTWPANSSRSHRPPLPSLSQHEYAKHSSPTCSHVQSHAPTRAQFTHNVVRNKQEKGQQCIQRCIILTFSEAWVHSTKIQPHLFSAVRHNVFLALTWNTSERSVEHKSFTFGCKNYCYDRRLDDLWCFQCLCISLELVRTQNCPILMINETKIFRPQDI